MSDDTGTGTVTTTAEFETALEELLAAAERNGIDPRGSWVCDSDEASLATWEVVVYELE